MKLGIYGGLFDPIHDAHLRLITTFITQYQLDRFHIVPCYHPPHRDGASASFEHRMALIDLALQSVAIPPSCTVLIDPQESLRNTPSYTYDTVLNIKNNFPKADVSLLLGQDAFEAFHTWHKPDEILKLCTLVVAKRPTESTTSTHASSRGLTAGSIMMDPAVKPRDDRPGVQYLNTPMQSISSTDIRQRLVHQQSLDGLIPKACLEYINANHLYT